MEKACRHVALMCGSGIVKRSVTQLVEDID